MKIKTKDILATLLIFLIFLGFVIGGTSLIVYGYNHNDDLDLVFGLVVACLGLFQIFQKYKIGYFFCHHPHFVSCSRFIRNIHFYSFLPSLLLQRIFESGFRSVDLKRLVCKVSNNNY